jgi:archaellum component FlaG (FlaF/FlaG flagellin family)
MVVSKVDHSSTSTQVYCIFLFLFSASLFGTLISQVNEIVAQHTNKAKELDKILEAYAEVQPR